MKITIKELRQLIREEIHNSKKKPLYEYSVFNSLKQFKALQNPTAYFSDKRNLDWSSTPKAEKNAIIGNLTKMHQHITNGNHAQAREILYNLPDDVVDIMFDRNFYAEIDKG